MKTQSILFAALAAAPAALAHTVFTDFYVDGMPQGDGVAMRMSPNAETAGSPIASLDSDDMACNVEGTNGVSRVQSAKDGALLTFEIRSWPDDPTKERLDRGHKGPCAVYLKKVDSAVDDKATGDGWFKIFDHGYVSSSDRWCTDEIIDNDGLLSVHLPTGLEGGYYLARPEILALHNANTGDPQFYTGCAQIFLESTGSLVAEETVSIPGYVKYGQPATDFDIYNDDKSTYTLPGPKIANLTAKSVGSGSEAQTSQTEGLKPAGCIVENANWCGTEVSSYSTESGCWASAEECWSQSKACFSSAPPTGNAGCLIMQTKCTGIQTQCTAGNFNGPPNKGKVLTPTKSGIEVGQIMATVGAGTVESATATSAAKTSAAKTSTSAKATSSTKAVVAAESTKSSSAAAASTSATDDSEESASAAPVKSSASTAAAKSSASAAPVKSSVYSAPAYTVTIAPSSAGAPATTQAPEACPKGWKCVTVTEVELVTKTVYVTATADGYKKRNPVHRRHGAHRA